ncbi:MAG TPA: hypothetical protein VK184_27450 [Nostocaceae cyanobacterium]|nr:hypothetical protein [Nostocaceae cyanobacterium]
MANIQITQLSPTGFDLLQDQESFLNELNSQEVQTIVGGGHSKHRSHHSYDSYSDHYHHHKHHSCW